MIVEHGFEGLSKNFIFSTGPQPSDLLLIGEAGGENEDIEHKCFVGKAGRELDKFYLPLANLRRHEVRVTNLVPFHPYGNRTPVHAEVKFCEQYLLKEIEDTKPKILAPMGLTATQYFLGFVDLHTVHGIPHRSKRFPDQIILPTYHPALGLHQGDAQPLIVYDFQQLQLAITGNLPERPVDTFDKPAYIELKTRMDVFQSLEGCDRLLMGQDTEGYRGSPWGLSYSIDEGVAYVIRIQYKEALAAFDEWLQEHPEVIVILHNALHDLPILREMGVRVPKFEDTMVYAYCLCLEPQGLKDLAYRHCGMKMRSYEDVTGPAMRKITAEYLIKVAQGDWGLDPEVPERDSDQIIKYRQPQALHKRALRAVNDIFGMYTGTVIGDKRGGSTRLDEIGVRVDKVDHDTVVRLGLRKEIAIPLKKPNKKGEITKITVEQKLNAWFAEVPIPVIPKLEEVYGDFIWELKDPVPPEEPADSVKRWGAMCDDLEESVARCEEVLGTLPVTGLDAIEDQQVAIGYSARDSHATLAIRTKLRDKVEANGMLELAELDMSVLPYIDAMKTAGIKVNREHMLAYGEQLKIEMRQIQEKLHENLGVWINPSSSQQVAMVIYDMLGFPVEVKTETGQPSTNDKVLEALAPLNGNIRLITDYREMHKLRSTYAIKLPRYMDEFGRLHTNWKATRVPSGRLASSDPNLMAIPVRTERGEAIRRGFIPEDGFVFVGVDLSQIEMRILAHISKDPNLIDVFDRGLDIHSATAARMWKLPIEVILAEHKINGGKSMRSSAKNCGFGIVYGIGSKGLQWQYKSKTGIDYTEEDCQKQLDDWFGVYQYVKYYMERQKAFARRDGFVSSLLGRRRYLPGVHSTIPRIREEAHRQAINHPVQSGASEVIKIAMRNIWNDALPVLWDSGIKVNPILQIHDELCYEVEKGAAYEVAEIIVDKMQTALILSVPVLADFHVTASGEDGGSWADLK